MSPRSKRDCASLPIVWATATTRIGELEDAVSKLLGRAAGLLTPTSARLTMRVPLGEAKLIRPS